MKRFSSVLLFIMFAALLSIRVAYADDVTQKDTQMVAPPAIGADAVTAADNPLREEGITAIAYGTDNIFANGRLPALTESNQAKVPLEGDEIVFHRKIRPNSTLNFDTYEVPDAAYAGIDRKIRKSKVGCE